MKGKVWKRSMQILGLIIISGMALFSHKANQAQLMKVKSSLADNKLGTCSTRPNCVSSSESSEDEHFIASTPLSSFSMQIADRFFKDCEIIEKNLFYRHYACKSSFFKFIDDVEIYFYDGKLQYRSASRVGYSDLGVNRKRIESFKQHLQH